MTNNSWDSKRERQHTESFSAALYEEPKEIRRDSINNRDCRARFSVEISYIKAGDHAPNDFYFTYVFFPRKHPMHLYFNRQVLTTVRGVTFGCYNYW